MSSLGKLRLAAHAALAVVAVAASPETAGASTTSDATPTIRLSPYSGPSTSTVRIAGDGFGARERVEIGLDGEKIGTTGTLSSGSLSPVAVRIPAGTQPGQKQVSAEGEESGRVARRAFVVRTDWSQMGFNARRTSFNPFEDTIGRANAGDLSSAWTRHDCLISWSYSGGAAPTVARGLVWVGAIDDICAFDARSGALRHKIETPWGAASSYSSQVAATVAGSHRLFVGAPSGLHAYSAPTGQLLWQLPTDGYADASPAIEGGVVYVGSEGGIVYAVDAQSGQVRWKRETGDRSSRRWRCAVGRPTSRPTDASRPSTRTTAIASSRRTSTARCGTARRRSPCGVRRAPTASCTSPTGARTVTRCMRSTPIPARGHGRGPFPGRIADRRLQGRGRERRRLLPDRSPTARAERRDGQCAPALERSGERREERRPHGGQRGRLRRVARLSTPRPAGVYGGRKVGALRPS